MNGTAFSVQAPRQEHLSKSTPIRDFGREKLEPVGSSTREWDISIFTEGQLFVDDSSEAALFILFYFQK